MASINIRAKGQNGEREVADDLNAIIARVREELFLPPLEKGQVQRNQNQSAVGGCDLTGTYNLAIEVKRQEALSVNTWWALCVKSAAEMNGIPVLLFRQNAKPGQRTQWRCIVNAELEMPKANLGHSVRAEISYSDFKEWFTSWVRTHLFHEHPERAPEPIVYHPVRVERVQGLYDES